MNLIRYLNYSFDFFSKIKPRNKISEAFFNELDVVNQEKMGAIYEKLGKSQSGDDLLDALDDVEAQVEFSAMTREDALNEINMIGLRNPQADSNTHLTLPTKRIL